jgi:hypothetical protein
MHWKARAVMGRVFSVFTGGAVVYLACNQTIRRAAQVFAACGP